MELIYLASPYTHKDPGIVSERYWAACVCVRDMMCDGLHVFSPIVHSHPIAQLGGLPGEWEYWRDIDFDFIDRCDKMAVLMLPGWEGSVGVAAEIKRAEENSMQIDFINP